ncbi:hypothetical protein JNK13_04735 [bacterium]|nr:hypothetical protein [bacterium]
MKAFKRHLHISLIIAFLTTLASCDTNYWWSRGQAPSVDTLLKRNYDQFSSALSNTSYKTNPLIPLAKQVELAMTNLFSSLQSEADAKTLSSKMDQVLDAYMNLEGKLSPGSQPPYGELSSQLRSMSDKLLRGEKVSAATFGLFVARSYKFLASELSLPQPIDPPATAQPTK